MGLFDSIIGADAPIVESTTDTQTQSGGATSGTQGDDGSTPVGDTEITHSVVLSEDDVSSIIVSKTDEQVSDPTPAIDLMNFDIGGDITTLGDSIESTDIGADASAIVTSTMEPLTGITESPALVTTPATEIDPSVETTPGATLEDRISGFVAELERLKANDEMLLDEKKTAIEKLEGEMKELEKEVKKIQADEKKIDATISSLITPPVKSK